MKSQKIIVLIVSFLFSGTAFFSAVYPVFAQPSITIVTADFPPFKFKVGEKIVGLDTEIILAVFDRTGYDVSVEMMPFPRADRP